MATPASTRSSACTATRRSTPSSKAPARSSAWSSRERSAAPTSANPLEASDSGGLHQPHQLLARRHGGCRRGGAGVLAVRLSPSYDVLVAEDRIHRVEHVEPAKVSAEHHGVAEHRRTNSFPHQRFALALLR